MGRVTYDGVLHGFVRDPEGAITTWDGPGAGTTAGNGSVAAMITDAIRRECLDHLIVFHENSLLRTLACYFQNYHESRTHLSLGKDSPEPRSIQPPEMGRVVAVPQVGGLHHRYERRAA